MQKNRNKTIIFFISLVITGWQQQAFGQNSWRGKIASARAWGSDHKELIELIGCLTQIPGILATDSDKALFIKAAAALNLATTDTKIFKELFTENNGCLAKQCIYNIPKILAYILASRYDQIRLASTQKKLDTDTAGTKNLHSFKITQFFQLGIEVLFRLFAYIDALNAARTGNPNMAKYLSEAADWVELWRLAGRLSLLDSQNTTLNAITPPHPIS